MPLFFKDRTVEQDEIALAGFQARLAACKRIIDASTEIRGSLIYEYLELTETVARREKALEIKRRNSGVGSAP